MTPDLDDPVGDLARWFADTFADIGTMNRDFSAEIERHTSPGDDVARLADAARDPLGERARRFLADHPSADGAGLVFARPDDAGSPSAIEWWERGPDGEVGRCQFGVDPAGARFYEYDRLEWFTRAYHDGRPWIAGPYIDYLGVEQYIVTLTVQAVAHGRAVGAAGIDIRVRDLERVLLPILRRIPGEAAVLNPHNGVLVGNSSRLLAGDRLPEIPDGFRLTDLGDTGSLLRLLHR
ncbi:cache domain-containing protein [Pseudonocardia endophytica]|uniref:Cache domain-containing protein n=1 Tax=Pseudonocardia endophytica TaxID=401976 RepID=A0A4R1HN31_PSEEN|nr:cache domain-containing protein [Pseudonocardia endophytica]TCK21079.1 hypothetical protein EV378_5054 [Pseudonocardia endophytica]